MSLISKNLASTLKASRESSSPFQPFKELPHELTLLILSHLKSEQALTNCRLVCKDWNIFCEDRWVWKDLFQSRFPFAPAVDNPKREIQLHRLLPSNIASGTYASQTLSYDAIVNAAAIKDDTLFSGSEDGHIAIWDLKTGQRKGKLEGHQGPVRCLALSKGILCSGSDDATIKVWDIQTGNCVHTFTKHTSGILSVAIDDDTNTLYSRAQDNTIKNWNLSEKKPLHTLSQAPYDFIVENDNRMFFFSKRRRHIMMREAAVDNKTITNTLRTEHPIQDLVVFGGKLFAGDSVGTIKVWETQTQKPLEDLKYDDDPLAQREPIRSLFIMEGKLFAICQTSIYIWDPQTSTLLKKLDIDRLSTPLICNYGKLVFWNGIKEGNHLIKVWNFNAPHSAVLAEIAGLYREGNTLDAWMRLIDMPEKVKKAVYAELQMLLGDAVPFDHIEDALNDHNGFSSTLEQKAEAIENVIKRKEHYCIF